MKWKVCGMRHPENINEVAALQPDYMGFIFWEYSKRFVSESTPELATSIKKTGVFVNPSLTMVSHEINQHQLQAIQLHGSETPEFCQKIKALGVQVIKAFSIKDHLDFSLLEPYENNCDFFLFDTKGKLPGGNGYRFDWRLLQDYPSKKPFFLSGGIGIEHLSEVKNILKMNLPLYGIDVNSKFENKPAIKNTALLTEFINTLKNDSNSQHHK